MWYVICDKDSRGQGFKCKNENRAGTVAINQNLTQITQIITDKEK